MKHFVLPHFYSKCNFNHNRSDSANLLKHILQVANSHLAFTAEGSSLRALNEWLILRLIFRWAWHSGALVLFRTAFSVTIVLERKKVNSPPFLLSITTPAFTRVGLLSPGINAAQPVKWVLVYFPIFSCSAWSRFLSHEMCFLW